MTGLRTPRRGGPSNLIRLIPAKGSGVIQIRLNGQPQKISPELNLGELLDQLKINPMQVAVAKNLEVVVHSQLEDTRLHEGDEIEIFHAVGGG
jgi:thiamine biosynthesis protein ThiS